jgi:hypothetical protein
MKTTFSSDGMTSLSNGTFAALPELFGCSSWIAVSLEFELLPLYQECWVGAIGR